MLPQVLVGWLGVSVGVRGGEAGQEKEGAGVTATLPLCGLWPKGEPCVWDSSINYCIIIIELMHAV